MAAGGGGRKDLNEFELYLPVLFLLFSLPTLILNLRFTVNDEMRTEALIMDVSGYQKD